ETASQTGIGATAIASESGGPLFVGTKSGTVQKITAGADQGGVSGLGGRVLGISLAHGRFLVRLPNSVRVFTYSGKPVSTIHARTPQAAISAGGLGVVTTKGKDAQLWDASTGKLLHTLGGPKGHRSLVTDAEYSPNGLEVVTVSDD